MHCQTQSSILTQPPYTCKEYNTYPTGGSALESVFNSMLSKCSRSKACSQLERLCSLESSGSMLLWALLWMLLACLFHGAIFRCAFVCLLLGMHRYLCLRSVLLSLRFFYVSRYMFSLICTKSAMTLSSDQEGSLLQSTSCLFPLIFLILKFCL